MSRSIPNPPDRRSVALSPESITDHAAIQWCRRVRSDPDVLAWAPRGHLSNGTGVPSRLWPIVCRAREDMLDVLSCSSLHFDPPAWYFGGISPLRAASSAYLLVGDDHAVVLRSPQDRRDCPPDGWIAVTTIVRRGADSPETQSRRMARRERLARSRTPQRPGQHLQFDDPPATRPHVWLRKTYCWH